MMVSFPEAMKDEGTVLENHCLATEPSPAHDDAVAAGPTPALTMVLFKVKFCTRVTPDACFVALSAR
jgi:hypothetical protein